MHTIFFGKKLATFQLVPNVLLLRVTVKIPVYILNKRFQQH